MAKLEDAARKEFLYGADTDEHRTDDNIESDEE